MRTEAIAQADISDALLVQFSSFVADRIGLYFPRERWPDLMRGMTAVALDCGGQTVTQCMQRLLAMPLTQLEIDLLARHLAVGETYFFRDPASFDVLEREVLPQLIAARRDTDKRLRIWSAGCCSGEEIYSVAILLHRLLPDIADWDISLLGTDLSTHFLYKAEQGIYRDWSFRNAPEWIKRRYFVPVPSGGHAILPDIKQRVRFGYLNLAAESAPGNEHVPAMIDLVLCRNVLMYFSPAKAQQVIEKLHAALRVGGWLIVSPSEASHRLFSQFSQVQFPEAAMYRKGDGGSRRAIAASRPDALSVPLVAASGFAPISGPPPVVNAGADPQPSQAGNARALAARARACADQGRLNEAETWCDAAIGADKFDPALRYLQAVILEEQGRSDAAIDSLKQTLYLDPNFVLAHFSLGNLCRRQHREREAIKHFANAIDLLRAYPRDAILLESAGISAGHLSDMLRAQARQA